MRRLLEDFDALFDLSFRIGDSPLSELLERTVIGLEEPTQDWGTPGRREEVYAESGRFVSFFYRPHLFPGMETKLRLAHELQYRLLPRSLPDDSLVSISAVLESYCHLSGDLLGWQKLKSGELVIWIADLSGHGLRAGLASAVLHVLIGQLCECDRIDTLMTDLNRAFHDCVRGALYATVFAVTIDAEGHGEYCSAGHPPVLVRRPGGEVDELPSLDLPVGLFPETRYSTRDFVLEPEAVALLYTDGLAEGTGTDGEPFGGERISRILGETAGGPRRLTDAIYQEIKARQNIDELEDDISFLALRLGGD